MGTDVDQPVTTVAISDHEQHELTDDQLTYFPPTMACCYKMWLDMEEKIQRFSSTRGVDTYLTFFRKYTPIPCHGRNLLYPYYAYFGEVDEVLATAREFGIDIRLPDLYSDLETWINNLHTTMYRWGTKSDRDRNETRILWAIRSNYTECRERVEKQLKSVYSIYVQGRMTRDRYDQRRRDLWAMIGGNNLKVCKLNEAIAILKYLGEKQNQNPDNLDGDGSPTPTLRYEGATESQQNLLQHIASEINMQESLEITERVGLQRLMRVEPNDPIVLARFADYNTKFQSDFPAGESRLLIVYNHLYGKWD